MSDQDREKIVDTIEGLAKAVITAYVKYIDEHREIDSASVVTASGLYVAIIVESLSFDEDDPSEKEVIALVGDATMVMLKEKATLRDYMRQILQAVMAERQ
jgi:hypothetical protein